MINIVLDGRHVVREVGQTGVVFHEGDRPWQSRNRAVIGRNHRRGCAVPIKDDRCIVDRGHVELDRQWACCSVFSTVVRQTHNDVTGAAKLVACVLGDGQLVVVNVHRESGTGVGGVVVVSHSGPTVDLAGGRLLVGHVTDVRTCGVRDVTKELGVCAEAFGQDVVETIVF